MPKQLRMDTSLVLCLFLLHTLLICVNMCQVEAALEAELNGGGAPSRYPKAHARHEEGRPTDDIHTAKKTSTVERKGSLMHAATSEDWRRKWQGTGSMAHQRRPSQLLASSSVPLASL